MTLYKPTFESARFVAANMRAADVEEIHPLLFDPRPETIASYVMASRYAWLAAKERPIAVFGCYEARPKCWAAFAFGTDEFPRVAGEMTKFLVRKVKPYLFGDLGARRVEAYSHPNHKQAHAWLELLGAKGTVDPEYGPDGQAYVHFVMRRSDWEVTSPGKPGTIFTSGGTSGPRLSGRQSATAEHVPLPAQNSAG